MEIEEMIVIALGARKLGTNLDTGSHISQVISLQKGVRGELTYLYSFSRSRACRLKNSIYSTGLGVIDDWKWKCNGGWKIGISARKWISAERALGNRQDSDFTLINLMNFHVNSWRVISVVYNTRGFILSFIYLEHTWTLYEIHNWKLFCYICELIFDFIYYKFN